MNVLMIGNGFDLAHGLPTKYMDFLNFIVNVKSDFDNSNDRTYLKNLFKTHIKLYSDYDNVFNGKVEGIYDTFLHPMGDVLFRPLKDIVSKHYTENRRLLRQETFKKYDADEFHVEDEIATRNILSRINSKDYLLKYLHYLFGGNIWVTYFSNRNEQIGEDWIDFEGELTTVVETLESALKNNFPLDDSVLLLFGEKLLENKNETLESKIKIMINEFELFIWLFELYISVVNQFPVIPREYFLKKKFDKVITFNYTDTYNKLYAKNLKTDDICFMHGRAGQHNIILGAGHTQAQERLLMDFKKEFRRFIKDTDRSYVGWLDENSSQSKQIYTYGHSLGGVDSDIFKPYVFKENRDRQINILCYNGDDHTEKYRNIYELIPESVVEYRDKNILNTEII